jgi:hypothetical protein
MEICIPAGRPSKKEASEPIVSRHIKKTIETGWWIVEELDVEKYQNFSIVKGSRFLF